MFDSCKYEISDILSNCLLIIVNNFLDLILTSFSDDFIILLFWKEFSWSSNS